MKTLNNARQMFLSPRELSERWGVSEGHLANERSAKRGVPFRKFGRSVRYAVEDVEAYESACRVDTFPEHGPPV